jgi:hypothetical protein
MLSKQYLANTLQSHHPSHDLVTAPPESRAHLKPSLQTKYGEALSPYLSDGRVLQINYKKVVSAIHTSDTKSAIEKYTHNRVLGCRPPLVSVEEMKLPRVFRNTLRQLRSGFCKGLHSFLHRIGA